MWRQVSYCICTYKVLECLLQHLQMTCFSTCVPGIESPSFCTCHTHPILFVYTFTGISFLKSSLNIIEILSQYILLTYYFCFSEWSDPFLLHFREYIVFVCECVSATSLCNPPGLFLHLSSGLVPWLWSQNVLASIHGYTSVILNHTKKECSDFPAGFALHCPRALTPPPPHIGWHRDALWPEEGRTADVTEDHG